MNIIIGWKNNNKFLDVVILNMVDYSKLDSLIWDNYNGICPNWGNKLWFYAIYSMINTSNNIVTIRTTETEEEINEKFDMYIYPMANHFSVQYGNNNDSLVKNFSKLKIPVYVIACGIQTDASLGISGLVDKIGASSARLIEAVYNAGGEFALRGYYTKEFFDKVGYNIAVVTGCPSVYLMGRKFQMETKKVNTEDISPIFNGNLHLFEKLMKIYPQSVYMAQDNYEECLYKEGFLDNQSMKQDVFFSYYYSVYQAKLLGDNRIKMLVDLPTWYKYLHTFGSNFVLGTKLHGTIMSILAGIPSTLLTVDYRTQEVADFFHIPTSVEKKKFPQNDFYSYMNRWIIVLLIKSIRENLMLLKNSLLTIELLIISISKMIYLLV